MMDGPSDAGAYEAAGAASLGSWDVIDSSGASPTASAGASTPSAAAAAAGATEAAPPPRTPTEAGPSFEGWTCDVLRQHLRELGLQTAGNKALLVERCRGHYSGQSQLAFGCSLARASASQPGQSTARAPGSRLKCRDCGKYGHAGGDRACELFGQRSTAKRCAAMRRGFE